MRPHRAGDPRTPVLFRIAASLALGLRPDPSFLDIGDEREYYAQASAILNGDYIADLRRPIGYVFFEGKAQNQHSLRFERSQRIFQ